jgi:predicted nucleic acid-binding protein
LRFWDASAIVPLLVDESTSAAMIGYLRRDPGIIVWWATAVECASAISRRTRDGSTTPAEARRAIERLRKLSATWNEVVPADSVREQALRVVRVHHLRAADALQLAAALAGAEGEPASLEFVCLDSRLCEAADREGLRVLSG